MTNYTKGVKLERKAKKELEKQGYYIIRSAGSKGIWDIAAIGNHALHLIQIKRIRKKKNCVNLFKKDIQQIMDFQAKCTLPDCAVCELWIWVKSGKEWIKKEIKRVQVEVSP